MSNVIFTGIENLKFSKFPKIEKNSNKKNKTNEGVVTGYIQFSQS